MRVSTRKLASVLLVVTALGALSVVMAATAGAGGGIDHGCDQASPNYPTCVGGTIEPNDPGDPASVGGESQNVGGESQNVGGESQGLPITGGDILLFTVFGLVALVAGAFVVMNRRRYARVNAGNE